MFNLGDKAKVLCINLPVKSSLQLYIDKLGNAHSVFWDVSKSKFIGNIGTIVYCDYIGENYRMLNFGNISEIFHIDWLELYENQCNCNINILMTTGCVCGQMEREKK